QTMHSHGASPPFPCACTGQLAIHATHPDGASNTNSNVVVRLLAMFSQCYLGNKLGNRIYDRILRPKNTIDTLKHSQWRERTLPSPIPPVDTTYRKHHAKRYPQQPHCALPARKSP